MRYFIFLLLFTVPSANADIFKWTDKDGNVHFGDRPLNKENATELKIDTEAKAGITNSSGNDKERARLLKKSEADKKEKKENKKKFQAEKKKKKKRCLQANDRLEQHRRASGVYKLDAKGERQFYSFKQRADSEKRLKKAIAKYCR